MAGLKYDIRHVIVLHRPKIVDSACALALLQEEELGKTRSKGFTKEYAKIGFKTNTDKYKSSEVNSVK